MAEVSGRPLSLTTLQRPEFAPDEYRRILGLMEDAVAEGVPMRGQVAARPVGLVLRLDGRMHPLVRSATYQALAHLEFPELVTRLGQPDVRAEILAELEDPAADMLGRFGAAFALGDPPRYIQRPEDALDIGAVYDTLLSHDGHGAIYVPVMNFVEGDLCATREMLVHPLTVPGLGDAGAHCTMICDGSFTTYLLQFWGRDAPERDRLPIEWIIKQQCADTAALVGLGDRGVLAPGLRADINVIDLDALAIGAPEMLHDLPAGGRRLAQRATGYRATIVAGEVVTRDGEATGALPGRLVRGAR